MAAAAIVYLRALKTMTKQKKTPLNEKIVYIAWCALVSSLHFQVHHQQNNMFALKQVSLMALLIASAYAAPQLDLEANARNINTADYINVRDHPWSTLTLCRRVGTKNLRMCIFELYVFKNIRAPKHIWPECLLKLNLNIESQKK